MPKNLELPLQNLFDAPLTNIETSTKAEIACVECGTLAPRGRGNKKYCSQLCRNRARDKKPAYKAWRLKYWRNWYKAHNEHYRKKLREHYHKHAVRKLQESPWRGLLKGRKKDAEKRGIIFELDAAWAAARWTGKCELTGLQFNPPEKRTGYKNRNFSPSIDKIVPSLGYTKDNSRFVLWAINSLKRDGADEEMYQIAEALVANKNITRDHTD